MLLCIMAQLLLVHVSAAAGAAAICMCVLLLPLHTIACTLQLVTFFFIAILALHPHTYHPDMEEYPHFFKMPVLMLILITVLNDGTLISVAYDHVNPSHHPEKWNLKVRCFLFSVCVRHTLKGCV